jgi:negative regulator of sigma E activity
MIAARATYGSGIMNVDALHVELWAQRQQRLRHAVRIVDRERPRLIQQCGKMREAIRRHGVRQRFVCDIAAAQIVKSLNIEHS